MMDKYAKESISIVIKGDRESGSQWQNIKGKHYFNSINKMHSLAQIIKFMLKMNK